MVFETCRRSVVGSPYRLKDRKQGPSEMVVRIEEAHRATFSAFDVDGCLITQGLRCDFLVFPHDEAAVFVELKGGDVEKGFDQLRAALVALKRDIGPRRRYAVLVPMRYPLPPYQTAKYQDMFRKLGCKLRVKNRRFECSTSDF